MQRCARVFSRNANARHISPPQSGNRNLRLPGSQTRSPYFIGSNARE